MLLLVGHEKFRITLTFQLINCISSVLQKLIKYFDGTAIFASLWLGTLVLFETFDLSLSDSESF